MKHYETHYDNEEELSSDDEVSEAAAEPHVPEAQPSEAPIVELIPELNENNLEEQNKKPQANIDEQEPLPNNQVYNEAAANHDIQQHVA